MRVIVLTDNISNNTLKAEWGLSFYIEYNGHKILLDTGQSDAFISNAEACGINLSDVDYAVISHAHYDHSNGIGSFLKINNKAKVHISSNACENCYAGFYRFSKYIGLPKGVLSSCEERIVRNDSFTELFEGAYLVPHTTPGLKKLGSRNHLYIKSGARYYPDNFSHEQTLVFKTDKGLVVFNSCSHSGPEVVVKEVLEAFPGERVATYFGGLHLFRLYNHQIVSVAKRIKESNIGHIFTGHCTGERAYKILRNRLGTCINQIFCGMSVSL